MLAFLRFLAPALLVLALPLAPRAQSVGVGTATPAASAVLEVKSTTQGLLPPRLTAAQRDAIVGPVAGLLVFQTNGTVGMYYYTGFDWINLTTGIVPDAAGAAGPNPATRVTTLAGSGAIGSVNGTGAAAQFSLPSGVAADGSGNVYVAERYNNRIRRIVVATGVVTTLAGSGATGFADGTGTAAQFNFCGGVAADGSGNVYVSDQNNHRIRRIVVATGVVTTLAGSGVAGFADGTGAAAQFNFCGGVAADGSGNVYVSDQGNNRIRRVVVATGAVTTLAGSGATGSADGTGAAAQFNFPFGVALDGGGNVYVADQYNHCIRRVVVATGAVTTLAGSGTAGSANGTGTGAQFNQPFDVAADASGNVYVADQYNHCIRRVVVATGVVTTLAGSGAAGFANGIGVVAQFNFPLGVGLDGAGNLYVADQSNHRIRVVKQ